MNVQKIIQGAEHGISAGWQDLLKIGHFVDSTVKPDLQKAIVAAPAAEAILNTILGNLNSNYAGKASSLEAVIFGGNGLVTKALAAISAVEAAVADAEAGKPVLVDITDIVAALKALL